MDQELQDKIDAAVAEIRAKFEAEKSAALEAQKVEYDAKIAEVTNAAKQIGFEVIGTFRVKFGLSN